MKRKRTNEEEEINADLNYGNNIKYIPVDVTAEILSRLPIKSIGRFMSVSKSWRYIITSPSFYSIHAKNNPLTTFYATSPIYNDSRFEGHMVEVCETPKNVTTTVQSRVHMSKSCIQIVGSCNGLLCLLKCRSGFEAISIINPITNEGKMIRLKTRGGRIFGSNDEMDDDGFHIFGYSSSTNEYKVLKRVRNSYAILTIGGDKRWRKLSPHLFANRWKHPKVVLCNGAFHWLVGGKDDSYILAFDIAQESTRRMSIPPQRDQWGSKSVVLNDCLCLFSRKNIRENIMWKMEDYGDNDSWSQLAVVPRIRTLVYRSPISVRTGCYRPCSYRHDHDVEADCVPLDCATKDGGILLLSRRQYGQVIAMLYCPKKKKVTAMIRLPKGSETLFEFTPNFSPIKEIVGGGKKSRNTSYCSMVVMVDRYLFC